MEGINITDNRLKLQEFVITFKANVLQLPCELSSSFELFNTSLIFLELVTPFPINVNNIDMHFDLNVEIEMGVFHVFKIVQMLPNRATHHI